MRSSAVKGVACSLKEAAGDPCSAGQTVKDITVMRTAGTGVLVYSSSANKISNITQNGFGRAGTYGIRLMQGASASISASRFDGNTYGLHADPGTSATVLTTDFCGNGTGVYSPGSLGVTASHSIIASNTVNGVRIEGGGTHSFKYCDITGNGWSGVSVGTIAATVAVGSSNLFANGSSGDINLDAPPALGTPSITAYQNYWGGIPGNPPRSQEESAASIPGWRTGRWTTLDSFYGKVVLWPYPFMNNINEIFIDKGHVNYKAERAGYDLEPGKTKYAHLVYPATGIWNCYKPGVIRETNGNDALVVQIIDDNDEQNTYRAWATASKPGTITLNIAVMSKRADLHNMSTIAHEFGHCLGLDDNNYASDNIMTQGRNSDIPLSKHDKASYDMAYKLW